MKRVLLLRAGALGDLLLLRRAIATLRACGAKVGLVAPAAGEVLVGPGPGEVQELVPWDHPGLAGLMGGGSPWDELAHRLASYGAAIAYTRNGDLLRGLRRMIRDVRAVSPAPPDAAEHASSFFARPAEELLGTSGMEPPPLRPRPQDEAEALPLLGRLPARFLALHPGSGSPRKNWPAERFAALAERLGGTHPFLVVEGPADEEAVAALSHRRAVRARGLRLRALGALLSRAGLLVSNDSGVAHLAAGYGAPTLVLFGPTSAAVWAPLGLRVRVLEAPGDALSALDVETVAAAADEALRSFSPPPLPSG